MKYLKMFGLTTTAAVAFMAFGGLGTASATMLCKTNAHTNICIEPYSAGEIVNFRKQALTTVKLTTSFKNIECGRSSFSLSISTPGGPSETASGTIGTLTFEECNCEVKVLKNGSMEVHYISGTDNGTVTWSGQEITATCSTIFGNVHCIYATNATDLGTLTGGTVTEPAKIDASSSDIPRLTTNGLCDESANLDATYEYSTLQPLFVTAT